MKKLTWIEFDECIYSIYKQSKNKNFEGIIPSLKRILKETGSSWMKEELTKFQSDQDCPACNGKRLKLESLSIKIDETLEIVRLHKHRNILANALSHGQRQWLEIGLLIGNNAKLLLLDEPTAGMTSEETIATTKLINQLADEKNLSAIVIEHDINFVRELGAKITVLHLGKVFTEGTYEQIEKNKNVREIYLGKADA